MLVVAVKSAKHGRVSSLVPTRPLSFDRSVASATSNHKMRSSLRNCQGITWADWPVRASAADGRRRETYWAYFDRRQPTDAPRGPPNGQVIPWQFLRWRRRTLSQAKPKAQHACAYRWIEVSGAHSARNALYLSAKPTAYNSF